MRIGVALRLAKRLLRVALSSRNRFEMARSTLRGRPLTRIVLSNGIRMEAPEDAVLPTMIHEIFFERRYTPNFLPIEPDDIVVDIGANIGVFTVYAASRTAKTVYAFEPLPANVEFLKRNVEMNLLKDVAIEATAVNEKVGTGRLYLSSISGGHRLFDHYKNHRLERFVEVATTTLPIIMDENHLDEIDFLKMDCEGSEGPILASTPFDYLRRIRKIAMEFHDDASDFKHQFLLNRLEEADFTTTLRWDGRSSYGFIYARRRQP